MPRVSPKPPEPLKGDPALRSSLETFNAAMEAQQEREAARAWSEGSPYYPGGSASWFQDKLLVAESDERARLASQSPAYRGGEDPGPLTPRPYTEPTLESARERLETLRSAQHLGYGVEERYARARTARPHDRRSWWGCGHPVGDARLPRRAVRRRGPARGEPGERDAARAAASGRVKIEAARVESGAAVAVQSSENSAAQETDLDTATISVPIGLIAGQNDVSRQLFERSIPGIDEVLTRDLSRALAIAVDQQLVSGSGGSGQLRGLANVSGLISIAYTDASPTPAEFVQKVWAAFEQLSGSSGFGVSDPSRYLLAMHPRRFAWAQIGYSAPIRELLPFQLVISGAIRSNLGAGTNEDEAYLFVRDQAVAFLGEPRIAIYPEVLSATATVRIQATQYASLLVRVPNSVARISGTGLSAVSL